MDGGIALTQKNQGRNMWIVWTGGNDRSGSALGESFGIARLAQDGVVASDAAGYSRDNRWTFLGLVNEPCFKKATGPDPNRYGLWLDVRDPKCPPDPFANEEKYKGVQIGARGKTVPVGSYYGEASGIVGLRLFPNPDFDEKARQALGLRTLLPRSVLLRAARPGKAIPRGDVVRVLPRRPESGEAAEGSREAGVGQSQLECRRPVLLVGSHLRLESDDEREELLFQALHTSLPGTLDTSLVSTDNINNPRTMNAVYYLGPRMDAGEEWGKETLSGGGLDNKQFNEFVPPSDPLAQFFTPPSTTWTPRVLKDGSDSVGALGALNRVYLNIGLFSEEWLLHFRPLIGGQADFADQDRGRTRRIPSIGRRSSGRRRTWRASSSRPPIRTI